MVQIVHQTLETIRFFTASYWLRQTVSKHAVSKYARGKHAGGEWEVSASRFFSETGRNPESNRGTHVPRSPGFLSIGGVAQFNNTGERDA